MRGFAPWPGAFSQFRGARVHLWGRPWVPAGEPVGTASPGVIRLVGGTLLVACGQGTWLQVTEAQPEGRRRVTAREFASGAHIAAVGAQPGGEQFE